MLPAALGKPAEPNQLEIDDDEYVRVALHLSHHRLATSCSSRRLHCLAAAVAAAGDEDADRQLLHGRLESSAPAPTSANQRATSYGSVARATPSSSSSYIRQEGYPSFILSVYEQDYCKNKINLWQSH